MDAILSFPSSHHAILAERLLLDAGEPVAVMPLPAAIAAGCGIALRVPPDRRGAAVSVIQRGGGAAPEVHLAVGGTYRPWPPPVFTAAIGMVPGDLVALIGCGGKTALANRLAQENRHQPVLFSTTTRIRPPPPEVVDRKWSGEGTLPPGVTLACREDGDKLRGLGVDQLKRLRPPEGITIVEADGSRGLPLKGWADHEPAIPPCATVTVGVCCAGLLGLPYRPEAAHRPDRFQALTGIGTGDIVTVIHLAAMAGEMLRRAVGRRVLFLNQVETPVAERLARDLAARLPGQRLVAGSVRDGRVLGKGGGNNG
ncbi:MAG: putative selenium-dependent hydroxylase accessory protein YqeC [Planctomycetes bacterium]|nr:putative selenium-dependent hydroxylase accessory protein YqeC [Planctomycetota bacterium]